MSQKCGREISAGADVGQAAVDAGDIVRSARGLKACIVALVAGLIAVSIFETVLTGLRTYVFSHTTNRIDVELGARQFRHLLTLPIGYRDTPSRRFCCAGA